MALSSLGVDKNKTTKQRTKKMAMKKTLNKLVDYLKSNSYMYSPLFSHHPADFSLQIDSIFRTTGVEVTNQYLGNKKLMDKVWEYLKSDSYMYQPLINAPQPQASSLSSSDAAKPSPSRTGGAKYCSQAATPDPLEKRDVSPRRIEKQQAEADTPTRSTAVRHSVAYRGTVKHMIHHNCRSSEALGVVSFEEPKKIAGSEANYVKLVQNGF